MTEESHEPQSQPEVLAYGRTRPTTRATQRTRLVLCIIGAVLVPMGIVVSGILLDAYLIARRPSAVIWGDYFVFAGMMIGFFSILNLPLRSSWLALLILVYLPVSFLALLFCAFTTCEILGFTPW